jgi:hypothetical protein
MLIIIAGGTAGGVLSKRASSSANSKNSKHGVNGFLPALGPHQSTTCHGTICHQAVLAMSVHDEEFVSALAANRSLIYTTNRSGEWNKTWQDLGGNFNSMPTAVQLDSHRIDVFGVQNDRALYWRAYVNGVWDEAWSECTIAENDWSGPVSAVSQSHQSLNVYGRKSDGSVQEWWWFDFSQGFEDLSGVILDEPVVVGLINGTKIVYARGSDNVLYYRLYSNGFRRWLALGGEIATAPVVVASGQNNIDVFALSRNGTLCWRGYRSVWSSWSYSEDSVTLQSIVNAKVGAGGRIHVVAISKDDRVVHKSVLNSTLDVAWQDLGGPLNSAPHLAVHGTVLSLFGIGVDRKMYTSNWDVMEAGLEVMSSWASLGGDDFLSLA